MKLFALYLPQFHEIKENNEWWGKGFTEWTNVKKAQPLYKNHQQPKVPLNNNYYNLLDKETVKWQTDLMKQSGITGMIYYHYYFKGKKLLEKPAENLLQWQDINQPFFFCWANHSWNRAWKGSKEVLIEQTYGTEEDWINHFNYLLPFFKDSRYEKKDNKPVFMIYQPNFPEKDSILECFDKMAKEKGFEGIYPIEVVSNVKQAISKTKDGTTVFMTEPATGKNLYLYPNNKLVRYKNRILDIARQKNLIKSVLKIDGNKIYKKMLIEPSNNKIIHGIFFEWDNTPRHNTRGYVITPPAKELFQTYMNKIKEDDYVFINSWNEWAEGMQIEPTEDNKGIYLSWIMQESIKK